MRWFHGEPIAARVRACCPPTLLLICVLFFWSASADAQTRLHGVVYLGDVPTLVASELGFFAKQGLDMDVRYGQSGAHNLSKLRQGETDFALMAVTPLVLHALQTDAEKGPDDPLILASISHSIGLNFIMARLDGPIEHPGDLAGARIALLRGTNAELLLSLFLEYHGIDPDSVTLVDVPVDEAYESLAQGAVDAAVLWEPWASRLDDRFSESQRRFAVSNVYTARWLLVGRRAAVERDPDTVQGLLRAYREAIRHMDSHPDEAIALYARVRDVSEDRVRNGWDSLIYGLSLNWSLITAMQQQAEWGRDAGYAPPGARFRPLRLIAPGPLTAVAPATVGLPEIQALLESWE